MPESSVRPRRLRAADVQMKEQRRPVLMVRGARFSAIT